jgi:hypothetical protein
MFVTLAFFGFLVGAATYLVFDWLLLHSFLPSIEVLLSPWFLSGVAGSLLAIVVVYFFARYANAD